MAHSYTTQGLFGFLEAGASPFHAVAAAEKLLLAQGATYLPEPNAWALCPGGLYYTKRNGSSIIAFQMPAQGSISGYRIAAGHSDAPTWRIKTLKGGDKHYAKAEVEGYGGMIMSSWMDRPLSLAGRVMVKTVEAGTTKIESVLVAPQKALLCIPSVAIHFNRTINSGYTYNPQVDLQPIFGAAGDSLEETLKAAINLPEGAEIIGHDLVLCALQSPVALGVNGADFMAPRIDDLECAYTTLSAFLTASAAGKNPPSVCKVWAMFDNEEVGSSSRQGASGSFLPDVLARVEAHLGMSAEASVTARANSLLLSADNGHAIHPNHPEKSDPEHPITMGGGVVLKYNASQRYTTNAFTAALFTELCGAAGVQTQTFYNRADLPGGGTLGNLLSHSIAIPMLDIGLAQLAMHAAVETANLADAAQMVKAVTAVYEADFTQSDDGAWALQG